MKYLFIVLLLGGGYWYYSNHMTEKETDQTILAKIQQNGFAPAEDVKKQANVIATFMCNDPQVQNELGSSVEACLKRYNEFKEMCEKSIFPDPSAKITRIEDSKALMTRYTKCIIKDF